METDKGQEKIVDEEKCTQQNYEEIDKVFYDKAKNRKTEKSQTFDLR